MAHDIETFLTLIKGDADLLKETQPTQTRALVEIRRARYVHE